MLGGVHPLKALDEAAGFWCWEGLVERRLGVDVQVVLKQRDQVGVREEVVGDLLDVGGGENPRLDGACSVSDWDSVRRIGVDARVACASSLSMSAYR